MAKKCETCGGEKVVPLFHPKTKDGWLCKKCDKDLSMLTSIEILTGRILT